MLNSTPMTRKIRTGFANDKSLLLAVGSIAALGAMFRIAQYLADRSLWLDEAYLALDILHRSVREFVQPLPFNQGAPLGFLLTERAASAVAGSSELALRAAPLAASLLSLIAFCELARRLLRPPGTIVAVTLFAVAEGPIYFASEVKQYSFDVLATVALVLGALSLQRRPPGLRAATAIGALGIACTAGSHAALIVVPAVIGALLVTADDLRTLPRSTTAVLVVWFVSFVAFAALAREQLGHLRSTILGSAAPASRTAAAAGDVVAAAAPGSDFVAGLHKLSNAQADLLGLAHGSGAAAVPGLLLLAATAVGFVLLWRRDRSGAVILASPVPVALAAIAVHQYPLLSRTTLFILPLLLLLAAATVDGVWYSGRSKARAVAVVLAAVGIAVPLHGALDRLVHPAHFQELRPQLAYISKHWRPGDAIYAYYTAQYALAYYGTCDCTESGRGLPWPTRLTPNPGDSQFASALRSAPPALYVAGPSIETGTRTAATSPACAAATGSGSSSRTPARPPRRSSSTATCLPSSIGPARGSPFARSTAPGSICMTCVPGRAPPPQAERVRRNRCHGTVASASRSILRPRNQSSTM